jgi:hypothetical protein
MTALADEHIEALRTIATSTLAHQLQMRGIRSTFFCGLKALHPELRMWAERGHCATSRCAKICSSSTAAV